MLVQIVRLQVVQTLDGAIHKLNQYLVNKHWGTGCVFHSDRDKFREQHYISTDQLRFCVGNGRRISLLTANVFLLVFTYLFVNRKHEKLADKECYLQIQIKHLLVKVNLHAFLVLQSAVKYISVLLWQKPRMGFWFVGFWLWCNFIFGLNYISVCFNFIIIHNHAQNKGK